MGAPICIFPLAQALGFQCTRSSKRASFLCAHSATQRHHPAAHQSPAADVAPLSLSLFFFGSQCRLRVLSHFLSLLIQGKLLARQPTRLLQQFRSSLSGLSIYSSHARSETRWCSFYAASKGKSRAIVEKPVGLNTCFWFWFRLRVKRTCRVTVSTLGVATLAQRRASRPAAAYAARCHHLGATSTQSEVRPLEMTE